jgi:hypothetical protein
MATIGRITVAFGADTAGLLTGIEQSTSAIEKFATDVTKLTDSVASISDSTVEVTAAVDTSSVKRAQREIEDLSTEIEVSIDSESFAEDVEEAVKEVNKDRKGLSVKLYAETKEIVSGAAEAAKEVRAFGLGIYRPIAGAVSSLKEIYGVSQSVRQSFSQTAAIVGNFAASLGQVGSSGSGFRNTIVFAASLTKSLSAAKSGYESLTESADKFSGYSKAFAAFGSSQDRLTVALVGGGSAFASSAVSAAAYKASMVAVNKATEDLNPATRESVRYLASLAVAYGQVEVASRVSAASSRILQAALSAEVNIASAGANFFKAYASGVAEIAEESTSAADRARLYAKAAQIASSATASLSSFLSQARKVFLEFVLVAAGASKSAYDFATGLVSSARGSQAVASAFSAFTGAVSLAGKAFKDSLNSFAAGRQIYSVLELSYKALASTSSDLIAYTKVLGASFKAAYTSLPGAGSVVKNLSAAFGELTSTTTALSSALPTVSQALGGLVKLFTIGAVLSGKYRAALAQVGGEAGAIQDLSDRFGGSTQELQALTKASRDAGVSMAILARGQQAVFTSIGKIKVGQINTEATREAKIAFDRLGISIQDLRDKSPQEVFNEVADKLTDVQDASEKSAIAFDLFGAKGAAILPALKNLKEGRDDVARLGTALGEVEFKAFDDVDKSFKRVGEASKNLSRIMLLPLAPIQTGFNNFFADLQGGITAAIAPFQSLAAAASVPLQVILEVSGRIINIILRLAGAVAKALTAFAQAPTLAAVWKGFGSAIMDVLSVVELGVSYVEKFANAISSSVLPAIDGLTKPAENFTEWLKKLGTAASYFGVVIASAAAAKIALASMGTTGSFSLLSIAKSAGITQISFVGLLKGTLSLFRLMTIGFTNLAANAVASFVTMGATAIAGWLSPFLAAVASFVTGTTVASAAAQVSAVAMAAAWVIATLGIAAVVIGIIAIAQNFDKLSAFFSDFGNNIAGLFTFEGAADAARSVADAIWNAFKSILSGIGGFIGRIISGITSAFSSIKPPPAIDAAAASAKDIVEQRRRVAEANFDRNRTVSVSFGMSGQAASQGAGGQPSEDYDAIADSVERGRRQMAALTFEAAAFGETGSKAAIAAQTDFNKLLQQLSEGKIDQGQFEEQAKRIQESLSETIRLSDVISVEEKQQFFATLQDAGKQARKTLREINAGSVVEGRFFPTSDTIKRQAAEFERQYAARRKEIADRAAAGGFGEGEAGRENIRAALEDADREFKRNIDKIGRDTSFADNIRKQLETAFLSPTQLFKKELDEIARNRSLTGIERNLAKQDANKRFVEQSFGRTQSQDFADRGESISFARNSFAISGDRADAEERKLTADRRQAAGLDVGPALQLQLAIDKVQDAFGVAGNNLAQIQSELSPGKFAEYQEAIEKTQEAVQAAIVGESSARRFAEQRRVINEGVRSGAVDPDRGAAALRRLDVEERQAAGLDPTAAQELALATDRVNDAFGVTGLTLQQIQSKLSPDKFADYQEAIDKQRKSLLKSLGIDQSPASDFRDAVKRIKDSASALSPEEFAEAMENARDDLLTSLGIAKDPMSEFSDLMVDMNEALQKGIISQEEFAKGAADQRKKLADSLGIKEDPTIKLGQDIAELEKLRNATEEFTDPKTGKRGRRRIFTDGQIDQAIQDKRDASLPGTVDRTVRNFVGDAQTLDRAQFGKTQREIAAEAQKTRGDATLTAEQRQAKLQDLSMSKAQKEIKAIQDDAKNTGRQLTPEDKEKIQGLQQQDAEFAERRLSIQADLQDKLRSEFGPDRRQVQGTDVRSREGVDTFFRLVQGQDNPSLKAQLESARTLRNIYQALAAPEAAPIVAQLPAR